MRKAITGFAGNSNINLAIRHKYLILNLCALLLAAIMLLPLLNSSFFGDDAYNSCISGRLQYMHITLPQAIQGQIHDWLEIGRFFPIAIIYMLTMFNYLTNLYTYKIISVIVILVNIILFAYLVKLVTNSRSLSTLSILIAPTFIQVRYAHDPVIAFALLLPIVCILTILYLIFFIYHLSGENKSYLTISLFIYFLALLTYEIVLPFFILNIIIAYFDGERRDFKFALKASAPFFLLSLVSSIVPILLRIYFRIPLIGAGGYSSTDMRIKYIPNLDITAYIPTLLKQTTAAIPMSYYLTNYINAPITVFRYIDHLMHSSISIFVALGFIIFVTAYLVIYLAISKEMISESIQTKGNQFNNIYLFIFGVALLILPGVLISSSPTWQHELVWGTGYLPEYISYFGALMMTLSVIYTVYKGVYNANKRSFAVLSIALAIGISLTGAMTVSCNTLVIESINHNWLYPRLIIEDALENGLLKPATDGSVLLVDSSSPWWEQPEFYIMHSGVRLKQVGSRGSASKEYISTDMLETAKPLDIEGKKLFEFSSKNNIFYLRYASTSRGSGYAILGNIEHLLATNTSLDWVTAKQVYIYIHKPDKWAKAGQVSVVGLRTGENSSMGAYEPFELKEDEMRLVSFGDKWKLFSILSDNRTIDLKSLYVSIGMNAEDATKPRQYNRLQQLAGCGDIEYWENTPTCWMERNASLIIYSEYIRSMEMSINVLSFNIPRALEIRSGDITEKRETIPTRFTTVNTSIHLRKGLNIIKFIAPEGCQRPCDIPEMKNGDCRCLSLALQNISFNKWANSDRKQGIL